MEQVVDPGDAVLDEVAVIRARMASDDALLASKLLQFEDIRTAQAAQLADEHERMLAEAAIRDELSLSLVQPAVLNPPSTATSITRSPTHADQPRVTTSTPCAEDITA